MRARGCWLTAAFAVLPLRLCAQQPYVIIDLNQGSPYVQTAAYGINNLGQITGYGVFPVTGTFEAFVWTGGHFRNLGFFGYQATSGAAINDKGQVAIVAEGPAYSALLYTNGKVKQIGGSFTSASGMNSNGDVVGEVRGDEGGNTGYAYINGQFTNPPGVYMASAINDSDQIAGTTGYYWGQDGAILSSEHGCVYSNGVLTDVGSLSGNPRLNTQAFGINNAGDAVGYSTASDGLHHAFLFSNGAQQDLGTVGGSGTEARAINNSGLITGNVVGPYGSGLGAFIFQNGVMSDLTALTPDGAPTWSGLAVTGVNDNGWIVGYGSNNGSADAFLAVPASAMVPWQLACAPSQVTGGSACAGTVTISAPAPSGGLAVTLWSHNSAYAQVPTSVTVQEGQTSATFPVTTPVVTGSKSVAISASANGAAVSTTVLVTKVALQSLTLTPNTVTGGGQVTGAVTLTSSPNFDAVVSITNTYPNVAQAPASVTVSAGTRSATFTITTNPVKTVHSVSVTASFGGASKTRALHVTP